MNLTLVNLQTALVKEGDCDLSRSSCQSRSSLSALLPASSWWPSSRMSEGARPLYTGPTVNGCDSTSRVAVTFKTVAYLVQSSIKVEQTTFLCLLVKLIDIIMDRLMFMVVAINV